MWFAQIFFTETRFADTQITIFGSVTLFSLPFYTSAIIQFLAFFFLAFWAYSAFFSSYLTVTAYLPFTLMMLYGAVWQGFHVFSENTIAVFFLMLAIKQIIGDIRKNNSGKIFNIFLTLSIAAFFVPVFLCFFPVIILSLLYFLGGNSKTFLAMLFSILMPALCFLEICYLTNSIDIFIDFYTNIFKNIDPIDFLLYTTTQYMLIILSVICFIVPFIIFVLNYNNYKLQTRQLLFFLFVLCAVSLLLSLIFWTWLNVTSLLIIILVIFFITQVFTNLNSLRNQIMLLIFVISMIVIYILTFLGF
jgi:hypothetical protein